MSETKWKLTWCEKSKVLGYIFDLFELMKAHIDSASKVTLLGEKVQEGDISKGVRH